MKYEPIREYLKTAKRDIVTLTLTEIEIMVSGLPAEAKTSQFWANTKNHHRARRDVWMGEGFKAFYEKNSQSVRFERILNLDNTVNQSTLVAPTVYMTKVWGFSTPAGPLQFASAGWRKNALSKLKPDDLVVLVGTSGQETKDEEKGRLLGIMQPTSEPVMSLDFDVRKNQNDFVDGEYKWPFGLMNLKAWILIDRPKLNEISDRKFNMDSAQGIVELTSKEAELVLSLSKEQANLLEPTANAQARMERKHGAKSRGAPPPTTKRNGVMHMRRAPAYTYAMEIKGGAKNAYKIGWAFDYKKRAKQFNHASMPELGGLEYRPVHFHKWGTAKKAFKMEQKILESLNQNRHPKNNEIIIGLSALELEKVWVSATGH